MVSTKGLQQQIKDLLILHNGHLRIADHPQLVKDAKELNLDDRQFSHMINDIYRSINWNAVELMDQKLLDAINTNSGIIKEKDADAIINDVMHDVDKAQATSYMISKLQKLGLKPRDRTPLDWTSFKNAWMTEDAWRTVNETTVYWLDEQARTLERMGEISFAKVEETKFAIKNTHALPPLITVLTRNSSSHEQYARIIEEEPDLEKRYLRVIYKLNPSLPFRFNGSEYKNIRELLDNACSSPKYFRDAATSYKNGHIHIWIEECHPEHKHKLTTDRELNEFLTFLYNVDRAYPFFINDNKYNTPEELACEARKTSRQWRHIAQAINDVNIYTWFRGINRENWISQMEAGALTIERSGLYNPDEYWKATVQTLINTVDQDAGNPLIEPDIAEISLPALEAGPPIQFNISLKLVTEGFVKAGIHVENTSPAVNINTSHLAFHSQENAVMGEVILTIDPVQLVKDELYAFSVVVRTVFQRIVIPVTVKAVFPRKAFFHQLAKYALIIAAFFGTVRWMLDKMMHRSIDLPHANYMSIADISETSLNPLSVIFPFAVLMAGLFYSFRIIKKLEGL